MTLQGLFSVELLSLIQTLDKEKRAIETAAQEGNINDLKTHTTIMNDTMIAIGSRAIPYLQNGAAATDLACRTYPNDSGKQTELLETIQVAYQQFLASSSK